MGLRLFHITEFAQSMLSPAAQRQARHPALLIVLASFWLALAGNLPLWRELARMPMDTSTQLWLGMGFVLLNAFALMVLFSLLNWPWLLRAVITLLLCISACNTLLLWLGHAPLHAATLPGIWRTVLGQLRAVPLWQLGMVLGLLALLPGVLLWRFGLRRIPVLERLPLNFFLVVLGTLLFGLSWLAFRGALLPLLQDQPRWIELLSPLNTLFTLRP